MADKDTDTSLPEGDELPKAIEIEVEDSGVTEVEGEEKQKAAAEGEPEAEGEEKPKKKRRDSGRIQNLTHELDSERTARQRLEAELNALRPLAERVPQLEEQNFTLTKTSMDSHKARLEADLAAAERAFKAAKESGDYDAEIKATREIARAESGLSDVNAWNENYKTKAAEIAEKKKNPPQQQQQQQRAVPEFSEATGSWIGANPWFDGRTRDFDQKAHNAVTAYAAGLENLINAGEREFEVDSPEYWQEIDKFVARKFPQYAAGGDDDGDDDEVEVQPTRRTPPMSGSSPVAAARGAPKSPGNTGGKNKIALTGEEAELVRVMVDNGAISYPKGHPKFGQKMEYKEAYIRYHDKKQKNPARDGRN